MKNMTITMEVIMEVTKVAMVVMDTADMVADMVMAGMGMDMRAMNTVTMGITPDIIVNGITTMQVNMEDMAADTTADVV